MNGLTQADLDRTFQELQSGASSPEYQEWLAGAMLGINLLSPPGGWLKDLKDLKDPNWKFVRRGKPDYESCYHKAIIPTGALAKANPRLLK